MMISDIMGRALISIEQSNGIHIYHINTSQVTPGIGTLVVRLGDRVGAQQIVKN